jgi:chaperonin GroEL
MARRILFDERARVALRRGVDRMANALRVTLGPRGRHVLLARPASAPAITNDGVTIARDIELADPFENAGAQLVREVCVKTNEVVGDGTTTAAVLAQAIVRGGLRRVAAGGNGVRVQRGLQRAVAAAVEAVRAQAAPVSGRAEVARVAAVAGADDPALGALLADAAERAGRDGVITVEDAPGMETRLEVVEGMQLDRGWVSPYFVTEAETMRVVLEQPLILLYDRRLSALEPLLPVLQRAAAENRPLLVIAEDFEGDALAALVVNRLRGTLAVCAVRAPAFGDKRRALLDDIAVLTGGRVVSEEAGFRLESTGLAELGRVRRAVITRDETTLVGGAGGGAVVERIAALRRELARAESGFEREAVRERLARLQGGVACVHVGAPTELEQKEKRSRVEDALAAVRAAVEEGVVPGGGIALLRAAAAVRAVREQGANDDERAGAEVLEQALLEPARAIADNAGADGAAIVATLRGAEGATGFDALSGRITDLVAAGVVDPAKVSRTALVNAASIAGLLLTTEALIVQDREEEGRGGA